MSARRSSRNSGSLPPARPYLREVGLKPASGEPRTGYPFTIPAVRHLERLGFNADVTFLAGENGTGKSTLIEAIAVALGMNAEGGSRNFNFSTRASHSGLWRHLRLVRSWARPRDQYFLRAESFFNVATEIESLDREGGGDPVINAYGGLGLHDQSHGESFFALLMNRLRGRGLYLLDEPEAALSPRRQIQMLRRMRELTLLDSQFIIATHSPILMSYPDAAIVLLDESGYRRVAYTETDNYRITKQFLDNPEEAVRKLFSEPEA